MQQLTPTIMKPLDSSPTAQRGFTLIEALVSLVILALGVLGLAAVQGRMLVDTRTTNSRAMAIRLIGELSERIRINVHGANPADGSQSAYADGMAPNTPAGFQPVPAGIPAPDCSSVACNPAQQAAYDLAIWRQKVAGTLMGGQTSIWQISPRQLQVVIAWQANENTRAILSDNPAPATDPTRQVARPMQITGTAAGALCGASADVICHIDFIDIPPAR